MEWLRHVQGLAKFYSAIENIERILTRESEFYPQALEIPAIDRASQAAAVGETDASWTQGYCEVGTNASQPELIFER